MARATNNESAGPSDRGLFRTGRVSCEYRFCADCVEKLRNQSVADFLRKPMKRNSRKALTTRQRMAARERM
ncbi:MAG: hypothetical protein GKR99_12925 [Rhodobacteraceae bacterium]|nr:hypothetical protein [Paracoccaceae bacterium]